MTEIAVSLRRGRELSAMQRTLWASAAKNPESAHQNMALLWHIEGQLDLDRLEEAFAAVVAASDVLRTVIEADGGHAMAVVSQAPAESVKLEMSRSDAADWAEIQARIPLGPNQALYESVFISHPEDGTCSWFLNLHHVITDATSSATVFAQTAAAYAGEAIQLDSYYQWASENATNPRTVKAKDFWIAKTPAKKAGGLYGPLGSPTANADRFNVELDEFRSSLEAQMQGQLSSLSDDLAWTTLLITAASVLISKTSGATEFAIGLPVHGRSGPVAQLLVGPVMEVFPVDVVVEADDSLLSLHKRIGRSVLQTVRNAKPGSAPTQANFETVVNVIARGGVESFGDLGATTNWIHPGSVDPTQLLRLQLTTYAGGAPRLELDVNEALGVPVQRQRVAGHLSAVLAQLAKAPESPLSQIKLIDEAERAILDSWGTSIQPGPTSHVVSDLRAALANRQSVCIREGSRKLTGQELWQTVNDQAQSLVAAGVGPSVRVGVHMERGIDAVIAIYAIALAGGSYVPLDPAQPKSRTDALAQRAKCHLVLSQLLAPVTTVAELPTPSLEDEAYLLFTSGSTGEPKGVPITHGGLADYLSFAQSAYVDTNPPVAPLFTPLTFDLTVTTLFVPLLSGGQLYPIAADGLPGLKAVAEIGALNWAKATPSHLEILLRFETTKWQPKTLVVGGEAFTTRLAKQLRDAYVGIELFNEYGPTEAVVGCMLYQATDDHLEALADVPIGVPAPGIELLIVDAFDQPVPAGCTGELLIASAGLTTGYLKSSDGSDPGEGKFVHLPSQDGGVKRFYRSGDLVRLYNDETLIYQGRADAQIKVGGIRLEPSEVEAALEAHPAIRRAAARLWQPTHIETTQHCVRCGLPSNVPGSEFDSDGVCSVCHDYARIAPQAQSYFGNTQDLQAMLAKAQAERTGDYDCIHLLSGGKDSTYALYQLVELGFKVFALTLDNGFISEGAKDNARASAEDLGIDHEFMTSDVMNEIFADSLARHSNVCHGCYKTIYTLATTKADEIGAPLIFTGLSRGQLFETRLIPAQFTEARFDPAAIDTAVVQARKVYHSLDDGPNRLLDTTVFEGGDIFDRVSYVDYYRYTDVSLAEMLDFLDNRAPWVRPSDTGRSTNCLVNAAGIHTHILEQGYHNYAEPYAWDVRLGHKTRNEAIEELDDQLDLEDVASMLAEIGYVPKPQVTFTAWLEVDEGSVAPTPGALRAFLADRLPKYAIPAAFVEIDELPTSANGKLDEAALPRPASVHRASLVAAIAPTTATERAVVSVWEQVLGVEPVGVDDDFFALGGDSLAALEMVVALSDRLERDIPEEVVFAHTTPRGLGGALEALDITAASSPVVELSEGYEPNSLTPWEQGFVFEHLNDPDSARQNVGRKYLINGKVDIAQLAQAIGSAVNRHRSFTQTLGFDRSSIDPDQTSEIQAGFNTIDASAFDALAAEVISQPFDIDSGPLVRFAIQPVTSGDTGLVVVAHHGATDAGGLDQLWADISLAYSGSELSDLDDAYAVHHKAHWQAVQQADTSWVEITPEQPGQLQLGSVASDEGDGLVRIDASVSSDQLRTVRGATPMATALAALAIALEPVSSNGRLTVGLPLSAKLASASELGGCWLNVVPVDVSATYGQTGSDVLSAAAAAVGQAITRRMVPQSTVNAIRRQAGHGPLEPQVILAFSELAEAKLGDLSATHEVLTSAAVRAGITFFAEVRGDQLSLAVEYDGSLIGRADAAQMLNAFDQALVTLVNNPLRPIGSTEVAPQTSAEHTSLDSLVTRFAELTPDAVAVAQQGVTLTYGQLIAASTALANDLLEAGIKPNDRVGVVAPRHAGSIVGILGTLMAGATYVPLDPDYPTTRLAYMANDAQFKCVVATAATFGVANKLGVPVVEFSSENQAATSLATVTRTVQDAAYVIYTSGSTGKPKGVAVSHSNIMASTLARTEVYGSDPASFLLLSSFSFDSSMVGLFWTLATGGTVVLPDVGHHTDVLHLAEVIQSHGVSHTLSVPSLYRVLLEETALDRAGSLTDVIVAGEPCPAELVVGHQAKLPAVRLHNEYGPTETTVWSHHHTFAEGFSSGDAVPIGTAVPGVKQMILDKFDNHVPVGETGELVIGGWGVTGGYTGGSSDATTAFMQFSDNVRCYRTGDLVRELGDGTLVFVGRVDRQVKVRGFRVELEHVEAELHGVEGVSSAVAELVDGRLVAWVESSNAADDAEADRVKLQLVDRLAAHEVPAVIYPVTEIARTVNGKADRAALVSSLPAAAANPARQQSEPAPTESNNTIDLISRIWADVLMVERVGPDDNFFDLGGDSIINMRIVARLRQANIAVKPRDLFANPTPSELAAFADSHGTTQQTEAGVPLAGQVPMLEMQRWFFNQNFTELNHWNQSLWLEASEELDHELLRQAFNELLDFHEVLKTKFTNADGQWAQWANETAASIKLETFETTVANEEVEQVIESSLNIETGQLVAVGVRGCDVFVSIHHLVVDGVSWGTVVSDLTTAYEQLAAGSAVDLGVRPASQAQWSSVLENADLAGEWPVIEPAQTPRPMVSEGISEVRTLDVGQTDALTATIEESLVAALGQAWSQRSNADTVELTLESHGRDPQLAPQLDLTRTIGWFTSQYPLVMDNVAGSNLASLRTRTAELLANVPSLGLGFDSGQPANYLPPLAINYLGQLDRAIASTKLFTPSSTLRAGIHPTNHRAHDVGVVAWVTSGQLNIQCDAVEPQVSGAELAALADRIVQNLIQLANGPTQVKTTGVSAADLDALGDVLGQLDL